MKLVRSLSLALAMAAIGASTWAAQDPAGADSAPASNSMSGKSSPGTARMDTQMKAMREMHDKMMAAKTPEERTALMADHMKIMQDGMTMMGGMSPGGMGSMKGDMAGHHQMMEKRMEMMQATMQMMMDRLHIAPMK